MIILADKDEDIRAQLDELKSSTPWIKRAYDAFADLVCNEATLKRTTTGVDIKIMTARVELHKALHSAMSHADANTAVEWIKNDITAGLGVAA